MRNPFRSLLNLGVAAIAAIALAPVVFTPTTAYARGGGGGGGRGGGGGGGKNPGSSRGGGSGGGRGGGSGVPGSGGRGGAGTGAGTGQGGNKSGKAAAAGPGASKNPSEYLLLLQQDDSADHRGDFLIDALDIATIEARDKERAAALAANRELASKRLRADDMPRP